MGAKIRYNIDMNTKKCSKCKIKPIMEFHRDRSSNDGRRSMCKQCRTDYRKHRYYTIPLVMVKAKQRARNWFQNLPKSKRDEIRKKRREQYRPEYLAQLTRWQKANPEKMRQHSQKMYKKIKSSPSKYLRLSISGAIRQSLKQQGISKAGCIWEKLVGYKVEQLKQHLESRFTEGMTWENYGKWHIDHIVPIAFFKFDSPDDVEFKMCWRLENLQPMWAKDNMSKSNKIIKVA